MPDVIQGNAGSNLDTANLSHSLSLHNRVAGKIAPPVRRKSSGGERQLSRDLSLASFPFEGAQMEAPALLPPCTPGIIEI